MLRCYHWEMAPNSSEQPRSLPSFFLLQSQLSLFAYAQHCSPDLAFPSGRLELACTSLYFAI